MNKEYIFPKAFDSFYHAINRDSLIIKEEVELVKLFADVNIKQEEDSIKFQYTKTVYLENLLRMSDE